MRLYRGYERFAAVLAAIAAFLILAMSLWITYDVVTRTLFDFASPWAFDLAEYALVWITFLGAPWVLLQDRHIRIELLTERLPVGVQRFLGITMSTLAFLVCLLLAWITAEAAIGYYQGDAMMPRIWRIPKVWPYLILPVGSVLLGIAFALRLALYFVAPNPEAVLRERAAAGQGAAPDSGGIEAKEAL